MYLLEFIVVQLSLLLAVVVFVRGCVYQHCELCCCCCYVAVIIVDEALVVVVVVALVV